MAAYWAVLRADKLVGHWADKLVGHSAEKSVGYSAETTVDCWVDGRAPHLVDLLVGQKAVELAE